MHIDASPEKVWALVSDVTRIGEFSPGDLRGALDPWLDRPEVGASFKGHVKRNGVGPTYWSPCQVTACVPNEVFEFAVGSRPDDVTVNNWGYRLEPDGERHEGHRVLPDRAALLMRAYWTLLGPLRGRTNERGMRTTLERMKAVLETHDRD